jgi:hypothetical protein
MQRLVDLHVEVRIFRIAIGATACKRAAVSESAVAKSVTLMPRRTNPSVRIDVIRSHGP